MNKKIHVCMKVYKREVIKLIPCFFADVGLFSTAKKEETKQRREGGHLVLTGKGVWSIAGNSGKEAKVLQGSVGNCPMKKVTD